jgi:tRNA G18 (ribose-2'-O)-methylase SpoU
VKVERVASANDPRVTPYRGVGDPELVRARGEFIAEGRLVVQRVLEDPRYRVRSLLVNDAAFGALESTLRAVGDDLPIYLCETSALVEVTGYNIHRGCVAIVERPAAASVRGLLATARSIVALEAVANADNVGGVFRNAAAFGAEAVILSPSCCDPLYRKAIRTSMGAVLRVPFARADAWPAALGDIRAAGFAIVALTPREPAESVDVFASRDRRPRKIAVVAGAEGAGLSAEVESAADVRVRIPISGAVDSLNVAVAVGIALHRCLTPQIVSDT